MKTLRIFCLVTIALFSFNHAAFAATSEEESVKKLTKLLDQAQSMTGRFSQITLDATGTRLQETSGQLALKRPGLFRWHTDAPQEQLLISDNKQTWLYDPDLQQVTIQKMDQRMSHTPALLLSGDISEIQKNFTISSQKRAKLTDFILTPKDKDSLFNSLRLSFDNKIIREMQLVDGVGQRTNILFLNIKMNATVDPKLFKFDVPKGTDVIQE